MKPTVKITLIVISSILSLFLLLVLVAVILLDHFLEYKASEPVSYSQAVETVLTFNYEGESEKEAKSTKESMAYGNVTVYVDDQDTDLFPVMEETLDKAKSLNEQLLGEIKERNVDLLLFSDQEEFERMSDLENVSGYYQNFGMLIGVRVDDKQGILERNEGAAYFFEQAILHEYTHYAFDRKVEMAGHGLHSYPLWFQEGVADYIANDGTTVEPWNFDLVPFDQLCTHEQWRDARKRKMTDVYRQSYFAVTHVIEENGEDVIKEIIKATSESGDFESSFIDVTGLTYEELVEEVGELER
ncbi:collagenase [Guptibacillus algicola]|uniref:collagenase n=1 Tax=Guptibacillus algicola TaxID=225844 RepID=UPI001CD6936D|nr:collagenase [Alkalihalobacillus algicola]MCA0987283.1 collagenase [Alkalihalobacillus algicola]